MDVFEIDAAHESSEQKALLTFALVTAARRIIISACSPV
jgi:hypothetical protein